ncbi:MAG: hypothetical protein AAGH99_11910 [Planctomycetota bacterium]
MNAARLTAVILTAAALLIGGCTTSTSVLATVDQPMPEHLELALSSGLPTFGVGDELGWLAFGDLALAPLPGESDSVLVIAEAEPIDLQSFDWVGRYLAMAY